MVAVFTDNDVKQLFVLAETLMHSLWTDGSYSMSNVLLFRLRILRFKLEKY